MKKDVMVSVKGTQFIDGEKSVTELICEGKYEYNPETGDVIINYSELDGETGEKTDNEVSVNGNNVVLNRNGGQSTRMEFVLMSRCVGYYELPFGSFSVSTFTKEMEKSFDENGGYVKISYRIDFDRVASTDNEIEISVKLRG